MCLYTDLRLSPTPTVSAILFFVKQCSLANMLLSDTLSDENIITVTHIFWRVYIYQLMHSTPHGKYLKMIIGSISIIIRGKP